MPLVSATVDLGVPGLGSARPLRGLTTGVDAPGFEDSRQRIGSFRDSIALQTPRTH